MTGKVNWLRRSVVLALMVSVFAAALPANAEIGTVAAVNRDMEGTPPDASRRALGLGAGVVENERVETSEVGSGQLMFLDQTTLSVAPRSDIVLDNYIYDPDQQTGEIAISMTRGALRFIGGRITKKTEAIVKTPTATIGIRGGMAIIRVDPSGGTRVIQLAGEYTRVTSSDGGSVTLSRPNASAETGDDGSVSFSGLATTSDLAGEFEAFEGQGDGGSEVIADTETPETRSEQVAAVNSNVAGGEVNQPVSTSGEQAAPAPDQNAETSVVQSEPAVVAPIEDSTDDLEPTPTLPPAFSVPTGGAAFSPSMGFFGFDSVRTGSLIGESNTGDRVRIPVAQSSADFLTTTAGLPVPEFFAEQRFPESGVFNFGPGSGAISSVLGPLTGQGFSDLENNFHFVEFKGEGQSGPEFGFLVFGTPSPRQAVEFAQDGGTLPPTANTADIFRVEPDLDDFQPASLSLGGFVIANGGEARFNAPQSSLPANGGRFLVAEARVDIDPFTGTQGSDFTVLAAPILSTGAGSPQISGQIFGTDVFGPDRFIERSNIGTFEDADGHTVFGATDDYLVVSSLHRPNGTGAFNPDPGVERTQGGPNAPVEEFANILTRDPAAARIVNNPLPLASETRNRIGGPAGPVAALGGFLDGAFAAGIATCKPGNCGFSGPGGTGFYPLRTTNSTGLGTITFNTGQLAPVDNNEVGVIFPLDDFGLSNIAGAGPGRAPFEFTADAGFTGSSAYLNDEVFGLTRSGGQIINGISGQPADLLVASSGLAGDAGVLPAGVNSQPEFLRWGWWSASYRVIDGQTSIQRDDLVHLGTWVAGAQPDPTDLPLTGVASYAGLAVGTEADFVSRVTRVVGGSFTLDYDFANASGTFDLNIAGNAVNDALALGDPTIGHQYVIDQTLSGGGVISANGAFFSGGGVPDAATGGSFTINNATGTREVVGVFGGDKIGSGPSLSAPPRLQDPQQ